MELIKAKVKGETPVVAAAPERGKVINLMDALEEEPCDEKPPQRVRLRRRAGEKMAQPKATAARLRRRRRRAERALKRRAMQVEGATFAIVGASTLFRGVWPRARFLLAAEHFTA